MQLEKIITIANKKSYLRFIAMERSLRATGCNLPLLVIPYSDDLFDLPVNAVWWENKAISSWLIGHNCVPGYKKFSCLLEKNYLLVDADVIFLRDPSMALAPYSGFITCCGHWHNPHQTYSAQSLAIYKKASTTWQKNVFNAGQFACDTPLYDFETLLAAAENERYIDTALLVKHHEQNGLNLMVHLSMVSIVNLTLPPYSLQSSWAGDYTTESYHDYWNEVTMPIFLHWAGCNMATQRPVDQEFLKYLSQEELSAWRDDVKSEVKRKNGFFKKARFNLSVIKNALINAPYHW